MGILTEGKNRIRDLLDTDIDKAQFGTGTTSATRSDTAIESGISDTLLSTTSTTAGQFLVETLTINSLTGNGSSITEVAFIKSSNSTLMTRSTFDAITKDNTKEIRAKKRFFIK